MPNQTRAAPTRSINDNFAGRRLCPPPAQPIPTPALTCAGAILFLGLHALAFGGNGLGRRGLIVLILFLQTLLEGFETLTKIAHHARYLTAAAEEQQDNGADDDPMPDTEGTHGSMTPKS